MDDGLTTASGEWTAALPLDELWEGDLVGLEVAGQPVLLISFDGAIRAFRDRCPHQDSPLSEGDLDGEILTCARHLWQFDVTTGEGVNPTDCALTEFGVKVVDGTVYVHTVLPGA